MDSNLKQVNFLDVTLCLDTGLYWPYVKPNNQILYVHIESNHPETVLKQIPIGVQERLSSLSANEELFYKNIAVYQQALDFAGHKHKLRYVEQKEEG